MAADYINTLDLKEDNLNILLDKIPLVVPVSVNGISYSICCYNKLEKNRAVTLIGEEEILILMQKLVHEGDIVYDIGANVGTHSIFISKAKRNIQVFSFEAEIKNYKHLYTNVFFNLKENIYIFNCAIGSCTSKMTLFLHSNLAGEGGNTLLPDLSLKTQEVSVYSLDFFVSQFSLPYPNLVKIDVEGYEIEVINGMREIMISSGPLLLIEVHPKRLNQFYSDENLLYETLDSLGYCYEFVQNIERTKEVFIIATPCNKEKKA